MADFGVRAVITAAILAAALPWPAAPAGAAAVPAASTAPAGPAAPVDDWKGGSVVDKTGKFAYCVTESHYDNGRVLVIGRSPEGETNLAIGMPEAGMPAGRGWPVKIEVDHKLKRDRKAVAAAADMLVIGNGRDEELFDALTSGQLLTIEGPADRVAFVLKGTGKALRALRKCVEEAGRGGPAPAPAATRPGGKAPPPVPKALTAILKAAGLERAQTVSLAGMPAEERPADVSWTLGPVFGGMLENSVADGRDFEDLSSAYVKTLKSRCGGAFESKLERIEALPSASLRSAAVVCGGGAEKIHVALLMYLTRTRVFTVFFHEAAEADRAEAIKARDAIAGVIRQLAAKPADSK